MFTGNGESWSPCISAGASLLWDWLLGALSSLLARGRWPKRWAGARVSGAVGEPQIRECLIWSAAGSTLCCWLAGALTCSARPLSSMGVECACGSFMLDLRGRGLAEEGNKVKEAVEAMVPDQRIEREQGDDSEARKLRLLKQTQREGRAGVIIS